MRVEIAEARIWPKKSSWHLSTLRVRVSAGVFVVPSTRIELRADQRTLDCPLGTVKTWVHRARRELIGAIERSRSRAGVAACSAKSLKIV